MNSITDYRPSPIAGQWYSGNAQELAESVDGYIHAAALPDIPGKVIGIVAPHAGHIYSGPVAGYAFAAVKDMKPEIVAVLSPMHQPYYDPLLTSGHEAYQTPLGSILVDRAAVQALDDLLEETIGIETIPVRGDREHSLEIELPFLQRSLGDNFSLLPVMIRDQSVRVVKALGKTLAAVLEGRSALMVASTDLSHFRSQDTAEKLDAEMLRRIELMDPDAVLLAEKEGVGYACGRAAVAAVLWAAQELGGNHAQILNYATSGDITGDYHQVVGYGAVVITKK
jgi:AmmeMemoRadiSam system protein B